MKAHRLLLLTLQLAALACTMADVAATPKTGAYYYDEAKTGHKCHGDLKHWMCDGARTCSAHGWCQGKDNHQLSKRQAKGAAFTFDEQPTASRCVADTMCDGARTCSPHGWCQGEARPLDQDLKLKLAQEQHHRTYLDQLRRQRNHLDVIIKSYEEKLASILRELKLLQEKKQEERRDTKRLEEEEEIRRQQADQARKIAEVKNLEILAQRREAEKRHQEEKRRREEDERIAAEKRLREEENRKKEDQRIAEETKKNKEELERKSREKAEEERKSLLSRNPLGVVSSQYVTVWGIHAGRFLSKHGGVAAQSEREYNMWLLQRLNNGRVVLRGFNSALLEPDAFYGDRVALAHDAVREKHTFVLHQRPGGHFALSSAATGAFLRVQSDFNGRVVLGSQDNYWDTLAIDEWVNGRAVPIKIPESRSLEARSLRYKSTNWGSDQL